MLESGCAVTGRGVAVMLGQFPGSLDQEDSPTVAQR